MGKFSVSASCQSKTRHSFMFEFLFRSLPSLLRVGALSLFFVFLSACGGGDTSQEKGLLGLPDEPGVETPSTPTPTPTSAPSGTPTPTPSPTPVPDPGSGGDLTKPNLSVEVQSGAISASWSASNAAGYRLIYWPQDGVTPDEANVNSTSYQTEVLPPASYMVMVEAYDDFGNGIFSDPEYVEVP